MKIPLLKVSTVKFQLNSHFHYKTIIYNLFHRHLRGVFSYIHIAKNMNDLFVDGIKALKSQE